MKVPAKGSLPYFDKIQSVVVLATPGGTDHGWQLIIGRDPNAGIQNRYSVLEIDCQRGIIRNYACEVPLKDARRIQKELVKELVERGLGTAPRRITGWGGWEQFYYED
jgi:hypothetical protein